jgi:spore coat protein A
MWFHSHELGMTRLNIYAGLSGFYLLRGGPADLPPGVLPGPAPRVDDRAGTRYYEVPLMLQDRSFNADGSLFFPHDRGFFGDVPSAGPFIPNGDIPPIWNPEFFGNTIVVNGRTWPVLAVEPRRYRFRVLNASNTRVYLLKIVANPTAARPVRPALQLWLIGTDGGFLPAPVPLSRLVSAVGERCDVIVDFSGLPAGTELYLINEGPDEPYGGGEPVADFDPADPATTGQVMKFVVAAPASTDTSTPPSRLTLPAFNRLGTEIWELWNFTEDAHPSHLHQVQFQVIDRQPFDGTARPPELSEFGDKDTVLAFPAEITRVTARFDIAGRYVWHCHIVDHEDNEMMRPYLVVR